MPTPLFVVDAFTSRPFAGNPAAVCLLESEREVEWMRRVAGEMNLSETAFVVPRPDGDFGLRWFTPVVEVDLCGHATLASAHVLFDTGRLKPGSAARFHTRSGVLTATRDGAAIALDFPAYASEESAPPAGLQAALGYERAVWTGRTRGTDAVIELPSEAAVRALSPDFAALARIDVRATIVTTRSETTGFDFVSRFFAPRMGIAEDPVTGGAHCALAPYWAARLGKTAMVGYQASARGGTIRVRAAGGRTQLGGEAVVVTRGELFA
jgi:PhzF family phenazine biosynthesis protein